MLMNHPNPACKTNPNPNSQVKIRTQARQFRGECASLSRPYARNIKPALCRLRIGMFCLAIEPLFVRTF